MKKIKDRIVLGIVCNLVASIIPQTMNATAYKAGWTDMRFNQPAASLFLPKEEAKANTPVGKVTAFLVNLTMGSFVGVVMSYVLSITGRDKSL